MVALVRMLSVMQMEHDSRGRWLIAEQGLEALQKAGLAKWIGYEWTALPSSHRMGSSE